MSKQSIAKAEQGYDPKPVWPICSRCANFRSNLEQNDGEYGSWTVETEIRCAVGGFKVMKTGTCKQWEEKQP